MIFLRTSRSPQVTWIPDSNRWQDSGFLEQDSGFQSPRFQIPKPKNSWLPESGFPYTGPLGKKKTNSMRGHQIKTGAPFKSFQIELAWNHVAKSFFFPKNYNYWEKLKEGNRTNK